MSEPQPQSDAMPAPEQTGDRYQLVGEIARGGMSVILRGRDADLGRDLAIKLLLEKHANRPEVVRRFIEEAQIVGQLQHPGVVPVYDIGRFGDRPFFTMKLVKGHTLAALLAKQNVGPVCNRPETTTAGYKPAPQDLWRFLRIALHVAQTLAYAHAKGVIHRDLRPANIMVGAFGEVQVMHWGLAKVLGEGGVADEEKASRGRKFPEEGTLIRTARSTGSAGTFGTDTEAGSLMGAPAYIPPEQATGNVDLLDQRADVFGLGAILCEILTGKPPYVGQSEEEVRRKAANGDLADAHARLDASGADVELIALIRACLSPEMSGRPGDAQAVAEALSAYLDELQERRHIAELAEAWATARAEQARRRRLTLALAGTVLLAVTLIGCGWLWVKADRDARMAQVTRDVNEALNQATALREQAKAAPVGGAALFAQAREQAQRALALAENGPADETLKEQVRQLQAELDEEKKDRKLIAALDEARLAQAETRSENRFAFERAVPLFREALRAYGLPAGEGEPAAAAERIRGRPAAVREAIGAALDEWLDLAANPLYKITEPHVDWLEAVAERIRKTQGWTRELRATRKEKNAAKRRQLLEKLAESADVAKLTAPALTRLARKLREAEAWEATVRLLRRTREQYAADFWVNHDLGVALQEMTPPKFDEAVRYLTIAATLRLDSPVVHVNLGNALSGQGKLDEAIACYRKAIELDPKYAYVHNKMGHALERKGQLDEAIACYRKGLALDPKFAVAQSNLERAEQQAAARDKFPAFQNGSYKPATTEERLALVEWCKVKKLHHTAAGLYVSAFAAAPKLAENLKAAHRYNAACSSALAAAGQGEDAARLDAKERARLRKQALDWLKADLTAWGKLLDSGRPQDRPFLVQTLSHWQQDSNLAGLRDAASLAKLPVDEQKACAQLWADVAALLKKAETTPAQKETPR
jgi:serine/threonine protein kinase